MLPALSGRKRLPLPRSRLVLACVLIASALAGGIGAAPLAIGGDDIEARKRETRLSVEVRVNGRGPYQFVVDSGADTSVVGLRIARDLELPLGTPVTLNSMTARNIVDR